MIKLLEQISILPKESTINVRERRDGNDYALLGKNSRGYIIDRVIENNGVDREVIEIRSTLKNCFEIVIKGGGISE